MAIGLSKFRFKTRLLIGFGVIILLNLVSVIISIQRINSIKEDLTNIYNHPLAVSNAVREINGDINAIHRSMKDVVLSENLDELIAEVKLINQYDEKIHAAFKIVFYRFLGDMKDVKRAFESYQEWEIIRAEVISLMEMGKRAEAVEITKGKGAKRVKKLFEHTQIMIDFAESKADEFYFINQKKEKSAIRLLVILLVVILSTSVLFSIVLSNSISRPINMLIDRIKDNFKVSEDITVSAALNSEQQILEHSVGLLERATKDLKSFNLELEKKVEERTAELKKSEELLNITGELAKVGGWEMNIKSQELVWTKETFKIHDIKDDTNLSLQDAFNFYDEDSKAIISHAISNTIESGESFDIELGIITPKGERKILNARGYLRPNGMNKSQHLFGTFLDITQQKNAEKRIEEQNKELKKHKNHLEQLVQKRTEELVASNKELKLVNEEIYAQRDALEDTIKELNHAQTQLIQSEKMASLGILVAGVAHEINNPVNFISSSLSGLKNNLDYLSDFIVSYQKINEKNYKLILNDLKKNEAHLSDVFEMFRKSIDIIEVGVERTTKIVKSLKTFARFDEKELGSYDLRENIDNTLLILYNQYKNRIEIIKKYGKIPLIECYPGQINQVVMNVLTNAIHSIKDNGTITISTCQSNKNEIEVSIKDTGVGIPIQFINQIFDPFFTTKEVGKGTGIGLSISYNIIKDHKGEITVKSEEGKGSCFTIVLPAKQI